MRRIELVLEDVVTLGQPALGPTDSTIVGSPPIWKDDSDATYASVNANYNGPGNPAFTGNATTSVITSDPIDANPALARVFVRVRFAAMSAGMPYPRIFFGPLGYVGDATISPTAPTTIEFEMSGNTTDILKILNTPTGQSLGLYPPLYSEVGMTAPSATQYMRFYEAHVFIGLPSNEAPPCRMWPRDDDLGVGAGRNYPPPKSQQRSSRGVGYY